MLRVNTTLAGITDVIMRVVSPLDNDPFIVVNPIIAVVVRVITRHRVTGARVARHFYAIIAVVVRVVASYVIIERAVSYFDAIVSLVMSVVATDGVVVDKFIQANTVAIITKGLIALHNSIMRVVSQ